MKHLFITLALLIFTCPLSAQMDALDSLGLVTPPYVKRMKQTGTFGNIEVSYFRLEKEGQPNQEYVRLALSKNPIISTTTYEVLRAYETGILLLTKEDATALYKRIGELYVIASKKGGQTYVEYVDEFPTVRGFLLLRMYSNEGVGKWRMVISGTGTRRRGELGFGVMGELGGAIRDAVALMK